MTSRQKLTQAGFTLVELAIVLLIVGLLISGILKGQELIENSRTTATIQQIKSYEAAVNTFRDSYNALPGDIRLPQTRVPGCTAGVGCNNLGDGNGTIGATANVGAAQAVLTDERAQFWLHLALANLVTGIVPDYATDPNPAWATTLPAGRIAGGFLVGFENGAAAVGAANVGAANGHYVTLQASPAVAATTPNTGTALTSDRAAQIDRKLDDGQPGTGDVIAMGTTGCYSAAGPTGTYSAATGNSRVCSLAIKIMN